MRTFGFLLAFSLLFAACRTTRPAGDTTPEAPEEQEPLPEQAIDHAAYEDFDPAPYADEAPADSVLQHDVPASLMNNQAAISATRTERGYRIQITQTQDKSTADAVMAEAVAWWQEQAASSDAPTFLDENETPVYILYRQPYYRVRVGNFASQAAAQQALRYVSSRFPGAAVVPDTVTLPR